METLPSPPRPRDSDPDMASSPWPPGPFNHDRSQDHASNLHHHNPSRSVSSALETSSASGTPSRGHPDTDSSPISHPHSPSNQSRSRAVSSASSTYSTSSAIRRKPVPLSATQRVVRSPDLLESTLEAPEDVFSRQYSLDSPTLYEFPASSKTPFAPASSAKNRHSR